MHALAFLALAVPPAAPQLKDRPATDPLLGRWEATGMVANRNPDRQWPGLEYEFTKDGKWVIYRDGRELPDGNRSYTADPKARPAAIDLAEGGGKYPGVYGVGPDGDTLTVSFNYAPKGGPADRAGAGRRDHDDHLQAGHEGEVTLDSIRHGTQRLRSERAGDAVGSGAGGPYPC